MKQHPIGLVLLGMILIVQACNAPTTEPAPVTEIVVIEPTSTPTQAAPTEIVHTDIPGELPEKSAGHAADQDSARTADEHTAPGGDRFTYGEYERPFNAIAMDRYFPDLDIQFYEIFQDAVFTYAVITVRSRSPEGNLPGQYALEIDNDIDGKGDLLVLVSNPSSTDWTTANVQVWEDTNNDVGGVEPVKKDNADPGFIDGFETKVFDNGTGDDPDYAWARISPENPLIVQIAVKTALIDDDNKFLAGTWAGTLLDPSKYDFNDTMTAEQAGAAIKSFTLYPIQFLFEMDNACRVPIGVLISSNELGLCQVFEPTPRAEEEKIEPGSPGCQLVCLRGFTLDEASCTCVQGVPP
jgi:hypothetical protein